MDLSKDQWLQTPEKEKPDIAYFLTELYKYHLYSLEPEIRVSLEIC